MAPFPRGLHHVTAQGVVPEQLLPYVAAVSDSSASLVRDCVLHTHEGQAVLAAYPLHDPKDTSVLDDMVREVTALPGIERLTVLAAARPAVAPAYAEAHEDAFWAVPLPPPSARQKLRNMLHRAARDVNISSASGPGCWTPEHAALSENYIRTRPLEPGTRHIFKHLADYLTVAPDTLLWSARTHDGTLAACALGDYSSLHTAFYMFAFRSPTAPPGTADLLLQHLLQEAVARGHQRCNLGLGINPGVAFFKKKWQATVFLPCVQTSWNIKPICKSWLSRLFSS